MSTLRPEHLIREEDRLLDFIRPVLDFSSASLYFPPPPASHQGFDHATQDQAVLDRDILLLPLLQAGKRLGMLRLSGVKPEHAQSMLPILPHLLSACLQTIDLKRQLLFDPLTGVLRQEFFFQALEEHIQNMARFLQPGLGSVEDPGRRPDFALLLADIANMSVLNRQAGYAFGDQVLQAAAQAIQEAAGPHSKVSRIQGDSFGVLLPGIGPQRLSARAGQIAQAVRDLLFDHPISHMRIRPEISMGGACFPQDIKGSYLQARAQDQARHLFDLAREGQKRALGLGQQDVVTPDQILKNCGQILEIISSSRVRIDLGADHQARKGLHFQIQSQGADNDHGLGTELRLIQVKSTTSLAETILAPTGEKTIQPGDRVRLIENPNKYTLQSGSEKVLSENHGQLQIISNPRDFFPRWAAARSQVSRFTVSLISAPPSSLWDVIAILQTKEQDLPASSLIARYGLGGLLLYLPDHSPQDTMHIIQAMAVDLPSTVQPESAVGIGYFPCLDHTRGETLDMARQALEHAWLLPFPGLAYFDSTTLTLQGDRAFARNELRQAMHAYNQALLLDVANILARNSLAICLARVGDFSAACTEFRRILDLEPENYMAEYNYGYVCLKLQEREQARTCFQRCLELMPGHSYSLLRLGQMAEEDGNLEQAEVYCRQAAQSAPDQGAPHRVLGRLAWKRKDRDAARKHLHQALITAPQDPDALRLLARLTLEQGDDPEVAESLIRRSLGIQPDNQESLELLEWAVEKRDE